MTEEQTGAVSDEARLAALLEGEVRAVLRALRGSAVDEIRIEHGGVRIALRREWQSAAGSAAPPDSAAAAGADGAAVGVPHRTEIRAHVVGVFHRTREPDGPHLAAVDDQIRAGQAIGVIETLGLASDVEAPAGGRLVEFAVEDGEPVEYGQLLAVIAPG
ncbi:MAG: hypothetical protein HY332_19650 [Chloroflexi bacterium]|nr:hypothetical protein [Chloroflexota bacterium]